jgi:antitoxin component of MazEF toxin-antitoxin module
MATAHIKKVIKIGGSMAIILPAQWAKGKVQPGEEMVVVGDGELRIFPVHLKVSPQDSKDAAGSESA